MLRTATPTIPAMLLLQLAGCGNPMPLPIVYIDADGGIIYDSGLPIADAALADAAEDRPDAGAPDTGRAPDAGRPDTGVDRPDSGLPPMCPPIEPFGVLAGDTLPPGALVDCDGNAFDLQGMCEKKASYMFHFAGW